MRPVKTRAFRTVIALVAIMTPWCGVSAAELDGKGLSLEFCQACHYYEGTEQAGTVAPPLLQMKARFSDRKKLFQIIQDPTGILGKDTMMPPFGRNGLMTDAQINAVIDFLYTL